MGAHRLRVLHVSDLHIVDPAKDRHRHCQRRLGDVRALLFGRTSLAHHLLSRNHPEDRLEAADLLRLAFRDPEAMGIPEAAQIRAIQRDNNLT
jgi:hypothetical protein